MGNRAFVVSASTSHLRTPGGEMNAFLLILSTLFLHASIATAASNETTTNALSLSKENQINISKRLIEIIESDPLLTEVTPIVHGVEQSVLSSGEDAKWISPVSVSYKSVPNKYCRLATSDVNMKNTSVIPLPPQALHDFCLKLKNQYLIDATGDGVRDVAQLVFIKSNRGNFGIHEVLIYLADPTSEGGYCYSAQASRQLPPTSMNSAEAANRALREARKRLAKERFSCH